MTRTVCVCATHLNELMALSSYSSHLNTVFVWCLHTRCSKAAVQHNNQLCFCRESQHQHKSIWISYRYLKLQPNDLAFLRSQFECICTGKNSINIDIDLENTKYVHAAHCQPFTPVLCSPTVYRAEFPLKEFS